jgi:hypothetical protein
MRTEVGAIVQSEYGGPEKELRISKRQFKSEELGTDDFLVLVIVRRSAQLSARSTYPVFVTLVIPTPLGTPKKPGIAAQICPQSHIPTNSQESSLVHGDDFVGQRPRRMVGRETDFCQSSRQISFFKAHIVESASLSACTEASTTRATAGDAGGAPTRWIGDDRLADRARPAYCQPPPRAL